MPGSPGRTGNFSYSSDSTAPDGLPRLPAGISPGAAAKWQELMEQLPQHLLRRVDVHQLRMLAELLAMADNLTAATVANPSDHKAGRLLLQTAQQIHRLSSCYGLTPFDRARMQIPAPEEPDELELFIAEASEICMQGKTSLHKRATG